MTNKTAIFQELFSLIDAKVQGYRSDIEIDKKVIEGGEYSALVHVARDNGTHLYLIPETLGDDSPVPYLFGSLRPSEIMRQEADLFTDNFSRDNFLLHIWNGRKWKRATSEECRQYMLDNLRKLQDMRKNGIDRQYAVA